MKKLLSVLSIFLLAAFLFSSCNSSLEVTKRRYKKGYYVHHQKARHHAAEQKSAAKAATAVTEAPELRAVEYVKQKEAEKAGSGEKELLAAAASGASQMTRAEKKTVRDQAINIAVKHPFKAVRLTKELARSAAAEDDALSLLWVVVVVILIVYLLGLLLEWGNGNGLIHILGIIALVLLILWLLRIL